MKTMLHDLRIGTRALRRAPGYTLTALVVLALGIGATTTVYGVLRGVVLRPLPYRDADRLVRVLESHPPEFPRFSVAPGNFISWRAGVHGFASMAMFHGGWFNLSGRAEPARLRGMEVTEDFFATLAVPAAVGRTIGRSDLAGGGEPVVLSHGAWRTYFGGDPEVLGRTVTLDDRVYTVVGVMPPRFDYPSATVEVWTLWRLTAKEAEQHGGHYAGVIARLAPGVGGAAVHAELDGVAAQLEKELADSNAGWRTIVQPLPDAILGASRSRLLMLLGGVALVLLIAAANVASLTVVRATGRRQEFAIRRAQGATRRHLAHQALAEGVPLAFAGSALGLAFAAFALPLVRALAPAGIPRIEQVSIDFGVALFATAVSVVVGVAAAVLPTLAAARRAVVLDLREGGRGTLGGGRGRSRAVLVVSEIALATVLLVGAGLLGRSLLELSGVDPGFRAEGAVLTALALPEQRYPDEAATTRFYERLVERVGALPGLRAVGVTQSLPLVSDYVLTFDVEGRPAPKAGEEPSANYYAVSPGYFAAMDIPLRRGRSLTDADRAATTPVMLVSTTFADKFFPGAEPIGHRIRVGNGRETWYEIVGVVSDVRQYGLDSDVSAQMYVPFAQDPFHGVQLVARVAGEPSSYAKSIAAAVHEVDPDQPLAKVEPFAATISRSLANERFSALLILAFAATALLLAAVGLYGTVAYSVSQTTQEIGVRMALGARGADILKQVSGGGVRLAAIGLAIGVALAAGLARLIRSFLFGVTTYDPTVFGGVALLLLAVATLAALVPAWRASRIAPMAALRHE